jgi:hypothetical protein
MEAMQVDKSKMNDCIPKARALACSSEPAQVSAQPAHDQPMRAAPVQAESVSHEREYLYNLMTI